MTVLLGALLAGAVLIDLTGAVFDGGSWLGATPGEVFWLLIVGMPLAFVHARVPNGYLSLGGIAYAVASISLNPRAALLCSLVPAVVSNLAISRASPLTRAVLVSGAACWTVVAAWVVHFASRSGLPLAAVDAAGLGTFTVMNWLVTATVGAALLRSSPIGVLRRNLNRQWVGAFVYICVSAAIIEDRLDGTLHGYLFASLVLVLSLALADAVAGRQLNRALKLHLSDIERHLSYSRVIEGTVHNIRNFLAAAVMRLDEARDAKTAEERVRQLDIAQIALRDAVGGLGALSSGTSPRVNWSPEPVDLISLVAGVTSLVSDRAASKRVHVEVRGDSSARAYCDPGLIREVVTNLILNAIEAVAVAGRVVADVGWRGHDPAISVSDDGPGVADKYRDRLFEPHFTTKVDGSGIGLFVSYGIAREHRGDLLYEGNARGAVFTLILKQDARGS